ncbi:MAG: 23S rRNA (pseudouridine(1915)-N(3))-methyltransferase RlmH [Miltoncostaeaceae bacterium]
MGRRAGGNPRLQLACVGGLRAPLDRAGAMFEERIDRMAGLRVDEVKAEPVQRGEARARAAEGERLRARLLERAWVVALDPLGRQPKDSEAFAAGLGRRMDEGRPVAYVIGGAAGLDPDLLAAADERLAIGTLTMPHQLARVVLTEQVYRALCILAGHPYPH